VLARKEEAWLAVGQRKHKRPRSIARSKLLLHCFVSAWRDYFRWKGRQNERLHESWSEEDGFYGKNVPFSLPVKKLDVDETTIILSCIRCLI